jgi:hypothetical protein
VNELERDPFDPRVVAADYVLAALRDPEDRRLLLLCLRAGWLTPAEAKRLEPLADAIAYMAGLPLPKHRAG